MDRAMPSLGTCSLATQGFEVIKQLLVQSQPYKFILGARDIQRTQAAFDEVKYDSAKHSLTVLPLELSKLPEVKTFAQQALQELGQAKLDYVFLNAAMQKPHSEGDVNGSAWGENYIVNHLCKQPRSSDGQGPWCRVC
jgi:NADP-dependent 3-hydroxy acid dehydrogenase YdfG